MNIIELSGHAETYPDLIRQHTSNIIQKAIKHLASNNEPISVINIKKLTNLSKATIYRYKDIIGKENIRSYSKFCDETNNG